MSAPRFALAIAAVLVLAAAACKSTPTPAPTSADIEAQLEANLGQHATIYHGGCDTLGHCALANRDCGVQVLQDMKVAVLASGSIAVEWEHQVPVAPNSSDYWFVHSDGSGSQYYELTTDVAGDDCGSYCGWHEETYPPTTLFLGTAFHFTPGGSSTPIADFHACS